MASTDELFQPTLQDHEDVSQLPRRRPWRLGSQLYVAFFGGGVAVTAIAYLNAKRLGMAPAARNQVLAIGLGVVVAAAAITAAIAGPVVDTAATNRDDFLRWVRVGNRVVALGLYGILYLIQRSADRLYQFNAPSEGELYASLWGAGLLAVLVGTSLQVGLVDVFLDWF